MRFKFTTSITFFRISYFKTPWCDGLASAGLGIFNSPAMTPEIRVNYVTSKNAMILCTSQWKCSTGKFFGSGREWLRLRKCDFTLRFQKVTDTITLGFATFTTLTLLLIPSCFCFYLSPHHWSSPKLLAPLWLRSRPSFSFVLLGSCDKSRKFPCCQFKHWASQHSLTARRNTCKGRFAPGLAFQGWWVLSLWGEGRPCSLQMKPLLPTSNKYL